MSHIVGGTGRQHRHAPTVVAIHTTMGEAFGTLQLAVLELDGIARLAMGCPITTHGTQAIIYNSSKHAGQWLHI